MKSVLIEESEEGQKAHNSLVVHHKSLSILSNELSLRIVQELAKNPACALDLARSLKEHEQKIYYHIRKLEGAGIIKLIRSEKRFGMTANIYDAVSPVVATKLYEDGFILKKPSPPVSNARALKFLHPFIEKGKLNATLILGSPHPHGKYEATARDAVYISDFMLFLGQFLEGMEGIKCKIDTQVTESDLKENLIVFGNPKINTIADKINSSLPISFDTGKNFSIISSLTNKRYSYDTIAVIEKIKNPFNPEKEILLLAGIRSEAMQTAVLACINDLDEIVEGNDANNAIAAKVVEGLDKKGEGFINSVKFLE